MKSPREQETHLTKNMLESLHIPLDVTAYSSTNVVPKKNVKNIFRQIGHGFVITREMIEG